MIPCQKKRLFATNVIPLFILRKNEIGLAGTSFFFYPSNGISAPGA